MNASVHHLTPSMSVSGPRGDVIRQVEYLRLVPGEEVQALVQRQHYDLAGRLVAQRDARLLTPNVTTVYTLTGTVLKTQSADGGQSLGLPGFSDQMLQSWDANDNHRAMTYDTLLRLRVIAENAVPNVESFTYAPATADHTHNLRGQLTGLNNPSGDVEFSSYTIKGQPRSETRTFHDGESFTSHQLFSPLGVLVQTIDAGEHRQAFTHDVAGQLTQVQLQLNGQAQQAVLNDAQYNAAGQITEQLAGNGVTSRWLYREEDGRLLRQTAYINPANALQDFEYQHDPVGNVTRIVDHTVTARFFANQRVAGQRDFTHDSMYRLTTATGYADAPPSDNPGRPLPTDPKDRRNYVEHYTYDDGHNLIETRHVRDGASHTVAMFIDPLSNRGARWKPTDPPPDINSWFDRAGNQQRLHSGAPMHWNSRGELDRVILVDRNGAGANDEEYYRYSQGERVYKRHDTHTKKLSHFHEVRYVENLEIRTKDNGEELHLINVNAGVGKVTCLHWVKGKPAGINADQMRYILKDHLGSSVIEMDQTAQLISSEGNCPFGGTAWMVARSLIEADYKFVRYSDKEMDVTGFYYYGARYYATWLGRWISADPAGDRDGLNRYAFVGNNPLRYVDHEGKQKKEHAIIDYSKFITGLGNYASSTMDLMDAVAHEKNIGRSLLKNLVGESINAAVGFIGGYLGSQNFDFLLPDDLHVANFTAQSKPMFTQGLVGGNIGAEIAGALFSQITPSAHLIRPLIPQTSKMTVQTIDREVGIDTSTEKRDGLQTFIGLFLNNVVGSVVPGVNVALGMGSRVQEAEDIKTGLDPVKLLKIENMLDSWESAVRQRSANAEKAFNDLNQHTVSSGSQKIVRRDLQAQTNAVLGMIESTRTTVSWMREDGTTDSRYLMKQAHKLKRANDRH